MLSHVPQPPPLCRIHELCVHTIVYPLPAAAPPTQLAMHEEPPGAGEKQVIPPQGLAPSGGLGSAPHVGEAATAMCSSTERQATASILKWCYQGFQVCRSLLQQKGNYVDLCTSGHSSECSCAAHRHTHLVQFFASMVHHDLLDLAVTPCLVHAAGS